MSPAGVLERFIAIFDRFHCGSIWGILGRLIGLFFDRLTQALLTRPPWALSVKSKCLQALSIHRSPRIVSASTLGIQIKRCDLVPPLDTHRLERFLHDLAANLAKPPGSWGSSRLIPVPPCDPNTTTTFIDPAKFCFIPDQPQCDLTNLESKWLCWSNQSPKSLQRFTGQLQQINMLQT